jgi:hypothetical protein
LRLGVCDNMNYKFNFKIIKVSSGCYFGTQQMKIVGIEGACLLVLLVLKVQKFTPKNVLDILFLSLSLQPNTYLFLLYLSCLSLDTNQA